MRQGVQRLKVVLSVDVEFDVNGALTEPKRRSPRGLDSVFRPSGSLDGNDQGLGLILDTLQTHGLRGSFFVETLAARHFGVEAVTHVIESIAERALDHEIELHLHPEWQYFGGADWRDRLAQQRAQGWRPEPLLERLEAEHFERLLLESIAIFEAAAGRRPRCFRSGSLSASRDMYAQLAKHGIEASSNVGLAINRPADAALQLWQGAHEVDGVRELPVTSFLDFKLGLWQHSRLLTLIGCQLSEIQRLLVNARLKGSGPVVLLTHPSEFSLARDDDDDFHPHPTVGKRFEDLCSWLAAQPEHYEVVSLHEAAQHGGGRRRPLRIGPWATPARWLESRRVNKLIEA